MQSHTAILPYYSSFNFSIMIHASLSRCVINRASSWDLGPLNKSVLLSADSNLFTYFTIYYLPFTYSFLVFLLNYLICLNNYSQHVTSPFFRYCQYLNSMQKLDISHQHYCWSENYKVCIAFPTPRFEFPKIRQWIRSLPYKKFAY